MYIWLSIKKKYIFKLLKKKTTISISIKLSIYKNSYLILNQKYTKNLKKTTI